MHHHHTLTQMSTPASTSTHAPQQRRRKKRVPNYGTRTVEVRRGYNGFGFTISGQQPCRLSCIVTNSPADQAGLRSGDFLISVNGLNVSKLPHETVVQLIGNSFGSIRMQIAENYYSDSSDEENAALMMQQQQQQQQQLSGDALASQSAGQYYTSAATGSGLVASMGGARPKPRYMYHKTKIHRMRNSPQKKRSIQQQQQQHLHMQHHAMHSRMPPAGSGCSASKPPDERLRPLIEDLLLTTGAQTAVSLSRQPQRPSAVAANNTGSLADVANVSAIVRVQTAALEYRAVVGYLGTIEMPKQISHSSKLQTVRSCIRKLRQEKRQPTTVLMTILPDCLRLQAVNGSVLATYPSERLNYVSSSSESENRFFGLVTSAVHTSQADEDEAGNGHAEDGDSDEAGRNRHDDPAAGAASAHTGHISISNSCHVFVVDTKLCEHAAHVSRATDFRIQCTKDPISSLCLEFPNNSEYVVNLIRSMYTMRILPPATRQAGDDGVGAAANAPGAAAAHSPQPSNHSEISTTTSNSDSGIGFHNDCTNISDRIVVVDFPGLPTERMRPASSRPLGIFNNFDPLAIDKRLTVRAMPDPKTSPSSSHAASGAPGSSSATGSSHSAVRCRPNLLANFNLIKSPATSLTATRSCDDVLALVERTAAADCADHMSMPTHVSMDDISLHSSAATAMADDDHEASFTFLHPSCIDGLSTGSGQRKAIVALENYSSQNCEPRGRASLSASATPSKLSPQVFKHDGAGKRSERDHPSARQSLGFTAMDTTSPKHEREVLTTMQYEMMETWRSLQDIHMGGHRQADGVLDITNSEPDLANREQPANVSPFRRVWQQSSFRTPRTDKQTYRQSPSVRRAASMTASDNDVYVKSMDGYIHNNNGLKDTHSAGSSHQRIDEETAVLKGPAATMPAMKLDFKLPQITTTLATPQPTVGAPPPAPVLTGTAAWRSSFEQLLDDPAGLQTFAEFLKKEFSAENIYFWTACERFRHLDNETERTAQAVAIYAKHLSNAAMEPVNVDSHARSLTQEKLQSAERDIFVPAQKQIFNLMKFDSYQRFIRSDLYKKCVEAEERQQALPYGVDDLEELLKTNFCQGASSKLKKSASNAEDRRRKSLLPWHRKTRSKSREHSDTGGGATNGLSVIPAEGRKSSKIPQLSSSSLKLHSSSAAAGVPLSDVHSSRSSLSSFDTLPAVISSTSSLAPQGSQASQAEMVVPLCRVILSDGATTIVQTRDDETVGQLVERLLEKRGLSYQFYDVIGLGSSKSIDLQSPAVQLAGTEVHVEQRVAFKLDLPDPKVISVKSKPKKQLHEVIKCILEKYNYSMESVVVRVRDTHSLVDLSQPVTVADGLRLQIVQLRPGEGAGKEVPATATTTTTPASKFAKPSIPKSVTFPSSLTAKPMAAPSGGPILKHPSQSTLDEITNRVFNELLHNKVEAHATKPSDLCSIKSDDCGSETSSIFDRMRRRDSSSALKPKSKKKSTSSQHSEDTTAGYSIATSSSTTSLAHGGEVKKPLIAKLKAGVKLQVTERVAENQEELLEGLKRAQLARLEDQRGTEINFELPDFLKNKENMNAAASKLRKIRANLSPVAKTPPVAVPEEPVVTPPCDRPQPAPRLSITNRNRSATISPMKIDEEPCPGSSSFDGSSTPALETNGGGASSRGPPPLPPKPKVLPIKPTNWGVTSASTNGGGTSPNAISPIGGGGCLDGAATHSNSIMPVLEVVNRKSMLPLPDSSTHCAYLDQPSSSFV